MPKAKAEIVGIASLVRYSKRVNRDYRLLILRSLANNLDSIRLNAIKEIIVSKTNKRWSPYRMSRQQPSTPGRLTERKGYLIEMLRSKGAWSYGTKMAKMQTHSLRGLIRTFDKAGIDKETYRALLYEDISSSNPFIGKRISARRTLAEVGGGTRIVDNLETKQKLIMRFKWDSPSGIRGQKRPFISTAAGKMQLGVGQLVQDKLKALRSL